MLDFIGYYSGQTLFVVIIAYLIAVFFAIILHECAHGYVAYWNGDDTAKLMGRLTLNPIKHLDPLGALCFLFIGFGWAKPVPINPTRFRNYKKGLITTSIAGVVMNFVIAIISSCLYIVTLKFFNNSNMASLFLCYLFSFSTSINISLMIFNLLPIYPLDGFNIISAFLPYGNKFVNFMHRYGQILLLIVIITLSKLGIFSLITTNICNGLLNMWAMVWGI